MRLQTQLVICLLLVLAACSSADKNKMSNIGNTFAVEAVPPSDDAFNKQPAASILNFLRWYRAHIQELKKIEIVTHSTNPDSAKYYVVNTAGTERYLNELKKSGFVSDKYIDRWRAYFNMVSEKLKKTPQTEAPVTGLDFDFVMLSKDCEEDLKRIEKSTVDHQKIANDEGSITIGLPTVGRLRYWIEKQEDGKWAIVDIKDLRSALDQAQND
ncbi:hypothetical protein FAM09_21285 [Niastella caeni]|uniref:DUF3828 domain-containing protein n=1 Tax=Niastella caeni TaxID=2569763 RepID=A0A4S8HKW9_9BACT|nr:hypothetical protein [Niastella caeni]THU35928.1 hypothetical protein FAM09_21285 [Niastella caeni]